MTSAKLKKIASEDKEYLFQNYGERLPICFKKGDGSLLYDESNKEYIDFFAGIAVSNLGYNNKNITKALHNQIDKIMHSSNWYLNTEQIEAAKLISELSFPGKTLFSNSGTEANEAAIKLVRKYGLSLSPKRYQIVSFKNSFHGRTFGSMSATGQSKIHKGFGPIVSGFKYLPFNDINAFKKEIKKNKNITAVMIELIQGEGGIIVADKNFIKEVFNICKKNDIITIVDEIQTGIGRTGKTFAYQNYNIIPDIITLAKGLGSGIPVGAIHSKKFLAEYFPGGSHGSTFGGNHLACTAAAATLKEIKKSSIQNNTAKVSEYIFTRLNSIMEKMKIIEEIRGMGLHIGFKLNRPGMDIVKTAMSRGLIINCTAGDIIRIMPPLNIEMKLVKKGMDILEKILQEEDH